MQQGRTLCTGSTSHLQLRATLTQHQHFCRKEIRRFSNKLGDLLAMWIHGAWARASEVPLSSPGGPQRQTREALQKQTEGYGLARRTRLKDDKVFLKSLTTRIDHVGRPSCSTDTGTVFRMY